MKKLTKETKEILWRLVVVLYAFSCWAILYSVGLKSKSISEMDLFGKNLPQLMVIVGESLIICAIGVFHKIKQRVR